MHHTLDDACKSIHVTHIHTQSCAHSKYNQAYVDIEAASAHSKYTQACMDIEAACAHS